MHSASDAQRREDNGWESPLFPGCEDSPRVTTTGTFSSTLSWREGGIAGGRADKDIFKAGKELSLWVCFFTLGVKLCKIMTHNFPTLNYFSSVSS